MMLSSPLVHLLQSLLLCRLFAFDDRFLRNALIFCTCLSVIIIIIIIKDFFLVLSLLLSGQQHLLYALHVCERKRETDRGMF